MTTRRVWWRRALLALARALSITPDPRRPPAPPLGPPEERIP